MPFDKGEYDLTAASFIPISNFGATLTLHCGTVISENFSLPPIKRVIFHDPATIILWMDGTKTVVKCHNEPFDKEKGFAMAILKKMHGKRFHRLLNNWCK